MSPPPDKKISRLTFVLSFIIFLSYAYFFQSGEHNENARFDQIRSVLELGKWEIDDFSSNTADTVSYQGRTYPNKAPGLVLLGAPVWWLARSILEIFGTIGSRELNFLCYLTTIFTVSLFSALASAAVFKIGTRISGNMGAGLLIALGYSLGTITFPFSTLFFSHQLTASFLVLAFAILSSPHRNNSSKWVFLAGIFAGSSVVSEYPGVLGATILGMYAMIRLTGVETRCYFIMAGVFASAFVLLYHLLAFGDPFFIPYALYGKDAANAAFSEHQQGFMGVGIPTYTNLVYILFSLERGLFVVNPWLIFIMPALLTPLFIRQYRAELFTCAAITLSYLAFNAGFGEGIVYAGGACSTGPRHLIPMLPFASLLIASLVRWKLPRLIVGLAIIPSIAIMTMATATEPRVGYEYNNPVRDLFYRGYKMGILAHKSEGPFGSDLISGTTVAFNWGKLAGLPGKMQLLPLLCVWGIALFALRRSQITSQSTTAVSMLSLTLFASIPLLDSPPSPVVPGLNGLTGHYFSGNLWTSCAQKSNPSTAMPTAVVSKIDEFMHFDWQQGGPFPGYYSVLWRGKFIAPQEDLIQLGTRSDDGSCLYLDGSLVVDNWGIHEPTSKTTEIQLLPGEHSIEIRYQNEGGGGFFELLWGRRGEPLVVVPAEVLQTEVP